MADLCNRLMNDVAISIIPISSYEEMPACLDALRRQLTMRTTPGTQHNATNGRDLVSQCVRGKALSKDQTNVLTGISSSIRELANHVLEPGGQELIMDFMEASDGERVISFLTDGPASLNS